MLSASFHGILDSLFLVFFAADALDEVAPGILVKPRGFWSTGIPISRSTDVFTTAHVIQNVMRKSIPILQIQCLLQSSSVCQLCHCTSF